MIGYIKLYRKLLDNPIFLNANLLKTFIWCLLKATHKQHQAPVGKQIVELQPGQFVYGRHKAAIELRLKPSTVNDHMQTLKTRQIIDIKPNNKYSVITVLNWGLYQSAENDSDSKTDSKTDNKPTQTRMVNNNIYTSEIKEIVQYLNQKSGTAYRTTGAKTQTLIKARINEGFTVDDFKQVIDNKVTSWFGTDYAKYLRPETLFGTKFESYLNEKQGKQLQKNDKAAPTFTADELAFIESMRGKK